MDKSKKDQKQRLTAVNKDAPEPYKSKVKSKERKQLWDSLLEVYQKEVDKENISDFEEVEVNDLENWSMCHPNDSLRALPHLVNTNPELVSKVLPGQLEEDSLKDISTPKVLKQKNAGVKKKTLQKNASDSSIIVSFVGAKSTKLQSIRPVKKSVKRKSNSTIDTLNPKKKVIKIGEEKSKKRKLNSPTDKASHKKKSNQVSAKICEKVATSRNNSQHECNLKLSHFSKEKLVSNRADGRVFSCKLILKVCYCSESDVIL